MHRSLAVLVAVCALATTAFAARDPGTVQGMRSTRAARAQIERRLALLDQARVPVGHAHPAAELRGALATARTGGKLDWNRFFTNSQVVVYQMHDGSVMRFQLGPVVKHPNQLSTEVTIDHARGDDVLSSTKLGVSQARPNVQGKALKSARFDPARPVLSSIQVAQ